VEKLVKDFQEVGGKVSAAEGDAFSDVKQTLEEETLPHIQQEHDSDQKSVDDAAAGVKKCNDDFQTMAAEANTKAQDVGAKRTASETCAEEEATLKGKDEQALAAFNTFAKTLRAEEELVMADLEQPKGSSLVQQHASLVQQRAEAKDGVMCSLPAAATTDDDIEGFFADSIAFFTDKKGTAEDLWAASTAAGEALAAKTIECSGKKQAYEIAYCQLQTTVSDLKTTYTSCRTEASSSFSTTLEAAQQNSGYHKTDFTAVKHLLCYMDVLVGSKDGASEKLAACQGLAVSTEHLNIVVPALPEEASTDGLPGATDAAVSCA
jgi:hypothetical protein